MLVLVIPVFENVNYEGISDPKVSKEAQVGGIK